jgi:hypothetical protein
MKLGPHFGPCPVAAQTRKHAVSFVLGVEKAVKLETGTFGEFKK